MAQEDNKIILEPNIKNISEYVKVYDNLIELEKLSKFLKFLNVPWLDSMLVKGKVGDTGDGGVLDESLRIVDCLPLNNLMPSHSMVHWGWFMRKVVIDCTRQYFKDTKAPLNDFVVSQLDVLRYKPGGKYDPHIDASLMYPRRLSFIYFLNNDYEGGELHFPGIGEVKIQANRAILWPSNFMYSHGVKPVKKGLRYSLVAWIN